MTFGEYVNNKMNQKKLSVNNFIILPAMSFSL